MPRLENGWMASEEITVVEALRRAVDAHPDRMLLDFSGESFTYENVYREAGRLAAGLASLGVRRGDTVATVLDNNPDAVFVWLAVNWLGAVCVPVNTAFKGEFLRHQLADAGARFLVAEQDYAERIVDIAEGLPAAEVLLHRGNRQTERTGGSDVRHLTPTGTRLLTAPMENSVPTTLRC